MIYSVDNPVSNVWTTGTWGKGALGGLLLFLLHWEVCFDYGTSWGQSRLMFRFKLILKKQLQKKTIRGGIIKLMLRYSNLSFGSWTLATCEWLLQPSTSQDRLPCIFWRTLLPLKIKIQAARLQQWNFIRLPRNIDLILHNKAYTYLRPPCCLPSFR